MIVLEGQKVEDIIKGDILKKGVEKYSEIMRRFEDIKDLTADVDFQRLFNVFYGLNRGRTSEWKGKYYSLFEEARGKDVNYGILLDAFYKRTNRVEASFISKMVATIDPDNPIIDSVVLKHVQLKLPYCKTKGRIEKTVEVYESLRLIFSDYLLSDEGHLLVKLFKQTFGNKVRSEYKMLDFVLWGDR